MLPESRNIADAYWAADLGCEAEALRPTEPRVQPVSGRHADYNGAFILVLDGAPVVSVPPSLLAVVSPRSAEFRADVVADPKRLHPLLPGSDPTRMIGPAHLYYADRDLLPIHVGPASAPAETPRRSGLSEARGRVHTWRLGAEGIRLGARPHPRRVRPCWRAACCRELPGLGRAHRASQRRRPSGCARQGSRHERGRFRRAPCAAVRVPPAVPGSGFERAIHTDRAEAWLPLLRLVHGGEIWLGLTRALTLVRRLARHEWREYRELRLRALADSPSAFATTLADARARGDEDWSRQVALGAESPSEIALVAEMHSQLVGLVWSRIDDSDPHRAHLYQMWVDPDFRGLGAGRELLASAIRWVASVNARVIVLSVTCGDTPATRLYGNAGFEPVGHPEPLRPGSDILAQPMQLELRGA